MQVYRGRIPSNLVDHIYPGDCLELFRLLPDESVDLVVTSPPYNIGKSERDRKPLDVYLQEQLAVLKESCRALRPSGSLFWQVGSYVDIGRQIPLDIRIFPMLESLNMIPRNRIVWIRPHGLHATHRFSGRHETLVWFTKTDNYKFFLDPIKVPQKYQNKKHWAGEKKGQLSCDPLGKNPGDVWAFRQVRHNHEEETIHNCQFPEDLVERVMLSTTEKGDVVLDPYMGVGTTAVVAGNCGRFFVGAEIDNRYIEVALRRLAGVPDDSGRFPNLKTLRQYALQHQITDLSRFSFDCQRAGTAATLESRSFPEDHHLETFIEESIDQAEQAVYRRGTEQH